MAQTVQHHYYAPDEWSISMPFSSRISPQYLCLSAIVSVIALVILILHQRGRYSLHSQLNMEGNCKSSFHWRKVYCLATCLLSATVFLAYVVAFWSSFLVPGIGSLFLAPRVEVLKVFQVHRPVPVPKAGSGGCIITLMDDHVFGNSYGQPFIGKCSPTATNTSHDNKTRRL